MSLQAGSLTLMASVNKTKEIEMKLRAIAITLMAMLATGTKAADSPVSEGAVS